MYHDATTWQVFSHTTFGLTYNVYEYANVDQVGYHSLINPYLLPGNHIYQSITDLLLAFLRLSHAHRKDWRSIIKGKALLWKPSECSGGLSAIRRDSRVQMIMP